MSETGEAKARRARRRANAPRRNVALSNSRNRDEARVSEAPVSDTATRPSPGTRR